MNGNKNALCGSATAVSYKNGIALWKACAGRAGVSSETSLTLLKGMVKSYRSASMIMTMALSKDFGCQHPPSGVPTPLNVFAIAIGASAQEDFSSRTRRVRRKPLVKKYMPEICVNLGKHHHQLAFFLPQ